MLPAPALSAWNPAAPALTLAGRAQQVLPASFPKWGPAGLRQSHPGDGMGRCCERVTLTEPRDQAGSHLVCLTAALQPGQESRGPRREGKAQDSQELRDVHPARALPSCPGVWETRHKIRLLPTGPECCIPPRGAERDRLRGTDRRAGQPAPSAGPANPAGFLRRPLLTGLSPGRWPWRSPGAGSLSCRQQPDAWQAQTRPLRSRMRPTGEVAPEAAGVRAGCGQGHQVSQPSDPTVVLGPDLRGQAG